MKVLEKIAASIATCPLAEKFYSEKVEKQLHILYPAKEQRQVLQDYYRKKWSLLFKIWFAGAMMMIFTMLAKKVSPILMEGNTLERGEAVTLKVYDEENDMTEIAYDVQQQVFTDEEIDGHIKRFLSEYENLICGQNESLQEVHKNLVLQETYESYPMTFAWESTDYRLVGEDGMVGNADLTQAETVQLSVSIAYDTTEVIHTFHVQIVPPKQTADEIWQGEILAGIRAEDEIQKYKSKFQLPAKISGKRVRYEVKEDNPAVLILVFLPLVSILIYFAKDRDLDKELDLRKRNMTMKYPEFVSKFQLLLGAGMNVRNIFVRLSADTTLGRELTEEIELLVRDMKNGMSVKDALDRFGRRTANPLYIKFSALLIQNMKKGTEDLTEQLSKEAAEAFVLRKTNARRLGEEVGTKLLGPMILMLGVVMVVLIIPAFLSFQF